MTARGGGVSAELEGAVAEYMVLMVTEGIDPGHKYLTLGEKNTLRKPGQRRYLSSH